MPLHFPDGPLWDDGVDDALPDDGLPDNGLPDDALPDDALPDDALPDRVPPWDDGPDPDGRELDPHVGPPWLPDDIVRRLAAARTAEPSASIAAFARPGVAVPIDRVIDAARWCHAKPGELSASDAALDDAADPVTDPGCSAAVAHHAARYAAMEIGAVTPRRPPRSGPPHTVRRGRHNLPLQPQRPLPPTPPRLKTFTGWTETTDLPDTVRWRSPLGRHYTDPPEHWIPHHIKDDPPPF